MGGWVDLPAVVVFTEDVEEEGVHVIEEGLVVKKKFGEVAEVLAVDLLLGPVYLEHTQLCIAIYLIPCG